MMCDGWTFERCLVKPRSNLLINEFKGDSSVLVPGQ